MARLAARPMIPAPSLRIERPSIGTGMGTGIRAGLAPNTATGASSSRRSTTTVVTTIVAAFLLASAALSLYLGQVSAVATSGYQRSQLETEKKEWLARNGQLELELAKRRSLVWSNSQAVQRLGMVRADRPTFITVDKTSPILCASTTTTGCTDPAETPSPSGDRKTPGSPVHALDELLTWLGSVVRPEA